MDLMIDIETFSTFYDAAIVQVGWVWFDPTQPWEEQNLIPVSLSVTAESSFAAGLKADGATLAWWMKQSDEARMSILRNALPLGEVLRVLTVECSTFAPNRVWANPPQFDLAILNNAYRAVGQRAPWNHRKERCCRTLWHMCPDYKAVRIGRSELEHDAGADAKAQAISVINAYKILKEYGLTPA